MLREIIVIYSDYCSSAVIGTPMFVCFTWPGLSRGNCVQPTMYLKLCFLHNCTNLAQSSEWPKLPVQFCVSQWAYLKLFGVSVKGEDAGDLNGLVNKWLSTPDSNVWFVQSTMSYIQLLVKNATYILIKIVLIESNKKKRQLARLRLSNHVGINCLSAIYIKWRFFKCVKSTWFYSYTCFKWVVRFALSNGYLALDNV